MSQVLFSIIIPTRQRHDTLKYSIQSVINQTYKEFELIVMDNFSTPETAEVVASFNDPRIKYYRATERLSMSDNWELGLSYATGEYIFVLGDDDALMPDGLEIAFNLINDSNLSIISWNRFFYWWPSAIVPWRRNRLRMGFSQETGIVNSHQKLLQYCNYHLTYEFLPMVYNSFVHQDLITKIKSIHGKYFMSYCPDVASGILNAYFSDKYFYSFRPLSLIGVSGHSTGTSVNYQSLNSKPFKDYIQEEKKDISAELHPRLIPSKEQSILLADVLLQTKELYFPENQEFDVDIEKLLKRMSLRINVDPGSYENTLSDIKLLAQKYEIPLSRLNIPPKKTEDHQPPQGLFTETNGAISSLIINCDQAGISDVAQAAMLAQGILPSKEAFILTIKSAYPVIFQGRKTEQTFSIQQTVCSRRFLNELIGCVNLYQIDPSDLLVLADLKKLRKQLADFWLSVSPEALETLYSGEVGKAHCTLLSSEMKDQPLTTNEQAFVGELTAKINQEVNQPKAIHYLLAASLYYSADRLPVPADVSHLPKWFLSDYQKLAKV